MRQSHRSRLKFRDRTLDSQPNNLSVRVVSFQEFIGPVRRDNLGILAVLTNQQIGRSPDIKL